MEHYFYVLDGTCFQSAGEETHPCSTLSLQLGLIRFIRSSIRFYLHHIRFESFFLETNQPYSIHTRAGMN